MARVPDKDALESANRLAVLLKTLPSPRDDRDAYTQAVLTVKHHVVTCGGTFTDAWNVSRICLHGFSASCTSGFAGACHNWIAQVTLKAASASMAGAT